MVASSHLKKQVLRSKRKMYIYGSTSKYSVKNTHSTAFIKLHKHTSHSVFNCLVIFQTSNFHILFMEWPAKNLQVNKWSKHNSIPTQIGDLSCGGKKKKKIVYIVDFFCYLTNVVSLPEYKKSHV